MAGTSVLKLKVEDKEYNASLKQAQQGMQHLEQALKDAGKSFTQVDKSVVDYVRGIGQMEAQSKTARGRIGEMSSAFIELSTQYKHMSDEVKNSDVGKALAESMQQLKQRTIDAKNELENLNNELNNVKMPEVKGGGLFAGLGDKMSGALQVFGGNLMTKAAGAVANLGSEMYGMVQQGIELAKQGEGIRIAFERLGRGDILQGLREATHGTVTDLELMKAAVKFNDFKLPVEELGTMLAFAQQKAKDTGQSVDYMVDSIVTGLGRKSLMILDNLGLSAAEIKEKMAETGDMTKAVGEIIREQMAKAGDYVETAADRAAQANVNLQNKMEELGRKFAPLQEASNNLWTSMKIGIMDLIGGPLTNFINKLTEAGRIAQQYGVLGGNSKVGRLTTNLINAREENRQSIYQQQQEQFWRYINPREQQIRDIRAWQRGERGEALQGRINAITEKYGSLDATKIQAEVDAAKKMLSDYQKAAKTILAPVEANISTNDAINNVESLKVKLAELEAQRKKAIAAGDTELSKNLLKQINQTKADIRGLDPNALKTKGGSKNSTYAPDSIAAQQALVQQLTKQWNEAGADVRDQYLQPLIEAEQKVKDMQNELQTNKEIAALKDSVAFPTEKAANDTAIVKKSDSWHDVSDIPAFEGFSSPLTELENHLQELIELQNTFGRVSAEAWQGYQKEIDATQEKIDQFKGSTPIEKLEKDAINTTKSFQQAAGAVSAIGSAMQSIEDPTAKIAGMIAQAIASIAVGFSEMIGKDIGSKGNVWYGIATAAAGMASMVATISQIHSATGYAEGGIIKGNSYSGDKIGGVVDGSQFVGLNAGELVLNASQQSMLANNLQNGGDDGGGYTPSFISGEQIYIALNRYTRRSGKGELVTWR